MIQDERNELLRVAKELTDVLREHNKVVHGVIAKLVAHADSLLIAAADERDVEGKPTTKIVTYGGVGHGTSVRADGPIVAAEEIPKLAPGKRACSLCRKPGHRKQNCPNAHLVRAADKKRKER